MAQHLRTHKVAKAFGGRQVVDEVSLHVAKGTVVGLLGPNGAGKTTTFYTVVGIVRPDAGQVLLDDLDITREPMHRRAQLGIGYLAQEASVFRRLTVRDNLMAVLEFLEPSKARRVSRMEDLMEEFKVSRLADTYGYALSGGERRRVEIARALCSNPEFLLLDEPFAGVDPIAVADIQGIINYLREKGLGILITDHNVRETLSITNRAYVIHQGRILVEGGAKDIIANETAKRIYLGESFTMDEPVGRPTDVTVKRGDR